jgi:hypothetical protein
MKSVLFGCLHQRRCNWIFAFCRQSEIVRFAQGIAYVLSESSARPQLIERNIGRGTHEFKMKTCQKVTRGRSTAETSVVVVVSVLFTAPNSFAGDRYDE